MDRVRTVCAQYLSGYQTNSNTDARFRKSSCAFAATASSSTAQRQRKAFRMTSIRGPMSMLQRIANRPCPCAPRWHLRSMNAERMSSPALKNLRVEALSDHLGNWLPQPATCTWWKTSKEEDVTCTVYENDTTLRRLCVERRSGIGDNKSARQGGEHPVLERRLHGQSCHIRSLVGSPVGPQNPILGGRRHVFVA